MEMAEVFEHISKDKFRSAASKLLGECFLLKKHIDTASDYNFVLNNPDAFTVYFEMLGYELIIDEQNGVIALNNRAGSGRIHLKKIESILLLILRLLYIEKKKQLSQINDVIVLADEIYDKYNMLKLNARLDKTAMRNTLGMFQRYRLIGKIDTDMSNPETRIQIYPSILFAVTIPSLEEMYQKAKEKLDKYSTGGDSLDTGNTADDEGTDED